MESLADRLAALSDLHQRGLLTDLEFRMLKQREIDRYPGRVPAGAPSVPAGEPSPAPRYTYTPGTLNPVVPAIGLGLAAGAVANGGLGG